MPITPVVGRERQFADLLTDLEAALAGEGRLVVLSGPAGIGKTTLAQQLTAAATGRGIPVTRGRCLDDEGAPPLWPWTQILARTSGSIGDADRDTAGAAGAAGTSGAGSADSAAARFLLVDRMVQQLVASAADGGRVLVLEDLHWADESSLRALRHLAAELETSRLLVVVAARTPWPDAVATSLDDVLRRPGCRLVDLPALDVAAVGAYLRAMAKTVARDGTAPVASDPGLVAQVHRRTGGNPLLVTAAAGVLADPGGRTADPDVLWDRIAAATDVSRLAAGMMLGLDRDQRETVELAAILAERVDPGLLTEIAGLEAAQVAVQLRAAVRAGLLTASRTDDGYRFAHALVRDAIVSALDPGRRRDMHLRAGRRLAGRVAVDASFAAARALHLSRAGTAVGVRGELAGAAIAAAREADRRLGYEDAARWWELAVQASEQSGAGSAQVCQLLIEQAGAEYRGGRYVQSLHSCERAAGLARELRRGDLLAETAVVIQGVSMPQAIGPIAAWCGQARDLLEKDAAAGRPVDDRLLARLLAQHSWSQSEQREPAMAEETSSRALALARSTGDPAALLAAVHARSVVRWQPDGVPEQLELGAIAIREGTSIGRPISVVLGHQWRCNSAHQLGNLDAGLAEIEAVGRLADSTRLPLVRWHHLRMLAARAALEGRFDDGLAASQQAFELMAGSGDVSAMGMSAAYLQFVAMITGRRELIDDGWFDALFAAAPQMPLMQAAGALVCLMRGQRDEGAARYAAVRPMLFDPDRDARWMGVIVYAMEVVEALDDAEAAERVLAELEPWSGLPGALGVSTVTFRGALARDLGRMAAVAGDLDRAQRLLREAVETNVRLGARPFVVVSRVELATILDRISLRGKTTDHDDEIVELVQRAASEGRRLGMPGPVRAAGELLARRQNVRQLARAQADPLTAREHEIAALVAQALSNREIAQTLVLSERTVESHVRSILAKLGFSSRTEIATWSVTSR